MLKQFGFLHPLVKICHKLLIFRWYRRFCYK